MAELRFSSREHTDPSWDTVPWGLAPGERTWREAGRAPGSPAGPRHQELCSGAWERGPQPADWRLLKPELMGRPGSFERFHCRRRRRLHKAELGNEYPLPSIYQGKLAQCLRLYNCQAASNSFIKHVFSDSDVSGTVSGSWTQR